MISIDELKPILRERGNAGPLVIAGPCSAETEEQVLDTARSLADRGVHIFRAGIWKPRTKPGSFEGVGEPGLEWLRKVKEETGMLTATEVASRAHVLKALHYSVDILWIGARTTANPFAVQEIADAIQESGKEVAVLVKNPVNPDLELWIGALERIYAAGVRRLGAVHRGFSTYNSGIYRNDPLWRIPLELRMRMPQLPLLCDPSHIGGRRDLIAPLSQRAMDLAFDGLMVECHRDPDAALSDAAQQLTPDAFCDIVEHLSLRNSAPDGAETLDELRNRIDQLDAVLLDTLATRMEISRQIGDFKRNNGIPVVQTARFGDMLQNRIEEGRRLGLDKEFIHRLLHAIHEESVRQQVELPDQPAD